ncbi:MAG TPA: translocase [Gammaproteobacteria bacterium]|nr:translocase [Gammaproteobacteria bacterium]
MNHSTVEPGRELPASDRPIRRFTAKRILPLFANVSPAEYRCVALFFSYTFLLLLCYYILKTLREPLLLDNGSAEIKSYAYASVALALLFVVPLYSIAFRRVKKCRLSLWVTLFFLANLGFFYVAGRSGLDIGYAYYVWVGVFGVTMLAQFWANTSDLLNAASGQRLFPIIMAGAALGGLAGPMVVGTLYAALGPWPLMLIASCLLAATIPLISCTCAAIPDSARNVSPDEETTPTTPLGGFALVLRDRYLLLLAVLVVLLNCVNTMGDYLLTDLVISRADEQVAANALLDRDVLIATFYGNFYLAVNALTLIAQLLLVGRLFRWIGASGTLLVLPVIVIIGYGFIMFLPVFAVLHALKLFENSADYSIMNTARQTLYLHLPPAAKFEGKIAIDTFFCRLGDLLQAGIVFVGVNQLQLDLQQFALLNAGLALIWFAVAFRLAQRHEARAPQADPSATTFQVLPEPLAGAPGLATSIAGFLQTVAGRAREGVVRRTDFGKNPHRVEP